jgi:4'-phosphopantetheinyl transferase
LRAAETRVATSLRFRRIDLAADGEVPPGWDAPPSSPALAGDEVQLWLFDLDLPPDDAGRLDGLLTVDERERARGFKFERHRCRYVVGRARLRQILSRYGAGDPASLLLREGPQGKPELAGWPAAAAISFNLAHSGHLALCAVACGARVGVDVELIRQERVPQWDRIARRYFGRAEIRHLFEVTNEERYAEFLRIWTLKEACLKAAGTGLTADLARVDVARVLGRPGGIVLASDELWRCFELRPAQGAVGALVVEPSA